MKKRSNRIQLEHANTTWSTNTQNIDISIFEMKVVQGNTERAIYIKLKCHWEKEKVIDDTIRIVKHSVTKKTPI